jgi:hypothetical protein
MSGTMTERDKRVAKAAVGEALTEIERLVREVKTLKQQNATLKARAAALAAKLHEQGDD